jgi:Flp pilus assembly protein TadD
VVVEAPADHNRDTVATVRRALIPLLLAASAAAEADQYAVLIGIDVYQSPKINHLRGACADARAIGDALTSVLKFPKEHVHLLVSDAKVSDGPPVAEREPIRKNILRELDWLIRTVKPGDIVFFFYAGHGTQFQDQNYLMPADVDVGGPLGFAGTAISAETIKTDLKSLKNSVLVDTYDMCRSDPVFPDPLTRGVRFRYPMGVLQARSILGAPKKPQAAPPIGGTATFLSCSPGERSWEWPALGRGFFSYLFEQSLRHGADETGTLRLQNLHDAVANSVQGCVAAATLADQTPQISFSDERVKQAILATDLPPGNGGKTPLELKLPRGVGIPGVRSLANQADYLKHFQAGYKLYFHGKLAEAEAEFRKAATYARTAAALRLIGDCRANQHDLMGAEAYTQEAFKLERRNAEITSDLAYLYEFLHKDMKKACALFRRAVRLDPHDPLPATNLGAILHELHRPKESLKYVRRAYELSPFVPILEGNYAVELQHNHQWKEAKIHADHARALGLDDPGLLKELKF